MPPTPRPILLLTLLASVAVLLSGAAGLFLAIRASQWLSLGFEAIVLLAGGIGLLTGLGRFRSSHSMALFCVGGTVLAAGALSFLASGEAAGVGASPVRLLKAMARDPFAAGRLVLGGLLLALAALILILRRPRESLSRLGWSVATGAPVLIGLIALAVLFRSRPGADGQAGGAPILSLPPLAVAILAFVGFLAFVTLVSISVHCFIRALELGVVAEAGAKAPDSASAAESAQTKRA